MSEPLPISVLLLARDETTRIVAADPRARVRARDRGGLGSARESRATRAAAERLGARVIDHEFDGFGAQRQFALAQCRERWVLWIDADERPAARVRGRAASVAPGGQRRPPGARWRGSAGSSGGAFDSAAGAASACCGCFGATARGSTTRRCTSR